MFEARLHRVSENDAISKRKLWEGWLQWANRFSSLDSDNLSRKQFDQEDFELGSFLEMYGDGFSPFDSGGTVVGDSGTMAAVSKEIVSLDTYGEYTVTWSVTLRASSGECRFAGGVPFIGNTFIASAKDFKAEMGWYNVCSLSKKQVLLATDLGVESGAIGDVRAEVLVDEWRRYGCFEFATKGSVKSQLSPEPGSEGMLGTLEEGDPLGIVNMTQYGKLHLSGSGSSVVGRVSGNVGVILFCQPDSEFNIVSARLNFYRRVR